MTIRGAVGRGPALASRRPRSYPYGIAPVNGDPCGDRAPSTISCPRPSLARASHSSSFDQRQRPEALRTAMATAFFWPTSTTSRLPRVVEIAHDQEGSFVGDRRQQRSHQHDVHHRRFVDHQQAAVERVVPVAPEPAIPGVDLQQAVNRLRLQPGAAEVRRRGRQDGKTAGDETRRRPAPVTPGQERLVLAAYEAGLRPAAIGREFRLSRAQVEEVVAAAKPDRR